LGSPLYIGTATSHAESVAFDPQIKLSPYTATSGANGRAGWLYHGVEPKIETAIYHDIDIINTLWVGATPVTVMVESIKDTDEAWSVWVSAAQVIKPNQEALPNEHLGFKPEWLATDPGMNTDNTNYPIFAIAVTGSGT